MTDLNLLPSLPTDEDGPVFKAPWEAQAFAMAVRLSEQGVFSWPEWAETFGAEIKRAQSQGDPDLGDTYYHHWLAALERLVTSKGVTTQGDLTRLRDAWEHAAARTPHGMPISLQDQDFR